MFYKSSYFGQKISFGNSLSSVLTLKSIKNNRTHNSYKYECFQKLTDVKKKKLLKCFQRFCGFFKGVDLFFLQ